MNERERGPSIYYIPHNIFDGFSFLGRGMRFWIEAAIFALIPAFLVWNLIPIKDMIMRVIITLAVAVPLGVLCILGIRGEPLTRFIGTMIRFMKSRKVFVYKYEGDDDMEKPPFFELEKEVEDLEVVLSDTIDKATSKELRTKIKGLRKKLNVEIAIYEKIIAEEDAVKRKAREEEEAKQMEEIMTMADAFIARERADGKKIKKRDVKRIHAEYKDDYLMSLPNPPHERDFISRTQSAQDYMPIDRIEDGIIFTKGGRVVKVLGIAPINLPMFSQEQQDLVINNFALLLRSSPVRVQLKTMAKSADVESFINQMRKNIETEPSVKAKAMMVDLSLSSKVVTPRQI